MKLICWLLWIADCQAATLTSGSVQASGLGQL
jgi:hypothetical protein